MRTLTWIITALWLCHFYVTLSFADEPSLSVNTPQLYRWVDLPDEEKARVKEAHDRLKKAIQDPEFLLDHWIDLPTSPHIQGKKQLRLSLREAILLALRYNPNIQNAELDRIIQRYQLRAAYNQFELQYALAGSSAFQKSRYSGFVGSPTTKSYIATPEFNLKTPLGTQASLKMDNAVAPIGTYNPLLTFSITQPLLRGFGKTINEATLKDAIEMENLNKLFIEQAIMDQITEVISAYRSLILSSNNLKNQRWQLKEAHKTFNINEQKIKAGQLEPTANVQQSYQIESLSLMVEQANNDFETSALNLLQTIGLDPNMSLSVPSDVTLDRMIIPDLNQSIEQALHHNTEYLALQANIRADERAYEVAKNQQLWQLDLAANIQTGTLTSVDNNAVGLENIYNGKNINESAGVSMTIPLHDITRRQQLIDAKLRLEKDKLRLAVARRMVITTVKNIVMAIKSQAKQYELANRQVALAAESYALEKKKQQAGIASALDVSNTQNQLIQAQMSLINAKIAYLNQLSALQRILGTTLHAWKIQLRYTG